MALDPEKLLEFFNRIKQMKCEEYLKLVEKYMDDDTVELFVDHIEEFYGNHDDEELGMLANIMITGFVCAKELS